MVENFHIGAWNMMIFAADIVFFISDCLGQVVLIYRCWLVWEKKSYIILLPIIMALASLSCALSALSLVALLNTNDINATVPPLKILLIVKIVSAALALPFGTNALVTALIIGRIWYAYRREPDLLPSRIFSVTVVLVVESGALLVVVQLVSFVLYVLHHPGQHIITGMAAQCYGIAPTLITLRVAMGTSIGSTRKTVTTTLGFANPASAASAM